MGIVQKEPPGFEIIRQHFGFHSGDKRALISENILSPGYFAYTPPTDCCQVEKKRG